MLLLSVLSAAGAACSPFSSARPAVQMPEAPSGQAKCRIAASHENPLVTEWPASEKANLEARLREGAVAVSYSGCEMRLLPQCRPEGTYTWRRTTTSTDVVEIRNADELYAKLPLGAVSLEGELERAGRLAVQTTVSGQMQLTRFDPKRMAGDSSCRGATHVIAALSIGAFKLKAGGSVKGHASIEVASIGSGSGKSESEEMLLREAGVPARCEQSTEAAPSGECASPIQVFLRALPSTLADQGSPGMLKVRFLPVEADEQWEVTVGDRTLCKVPCEKWVDPAMPFTLKNDPGFWQRNRYIDIPDLREKAKGDRVEVRAVPRNSAEFVGGIVATSFAGIATVAGTVLTAVGCRSNGPEGTCTPGLITLPLGLAGLGGGIYLIVGSAPKVEVRPWTPIDTAASGFPRGY